MELIKPSYDIIAISNCPLELIEQAGRTCYQSEPFGEPESFVKKIINLGHHSVIEHASITIRFVIDRGVSHELVRHRICAISQESTRWCNYKHGVVFIIPAWCNISPGEYSELLKDPGVSKGCADAIWFNAMLTSEADYLNLLELGWSPQQARSVLPNSLKTTVVMTANFREWRHILVQRTSLRAHPQMREVMVPLLAQLKSFLPEIFSDLE